MAEIYLIRHGETDYNRRNIVQGGGIDSDLNDTGRAQGQAFFRQYGHLEFDRVYCTELKRTQQTLESFSKKGHEIHVLPELNEFGWGRLEGVEGNDEVLAQFQVILAAWRGGDLNARVPEGESPLQAWARAELGIARVIRETPPDGRVLICAHGRIMRVVLAQLLGYGLHRMDLFPHHNTALNLLSHNAHGRFRMLKLNDIAHLQ
jgi:broad specificity phosphatase PhoE